MVFGCFGGCLASPTVTSPLDGSELLAEMDDLVPARVEIRIVGSTEVLGVA